MVDSNEGADSKKGGGRKGGGRWEKEGRDVGGREGGRCETEGQEVGEEKFVKWEKTYPSPQKKDE